jgi:hypothetical protein
MRAKNINNYITITLSRRLATRNSQTRNIADLRFWALLPVIGASLSEPHSLVAHRAQAQCIMVRSFVVRTHTELFLQWFKSYRLFASHRLFWELSVFIQWFTVNFTDLSPAPGLTIFHATFDEIYPSCQRTNGNWNGQYYLQCSVLLSPSQFYFYRVSCGSNSDTKSDFICHLGWIFCISVILL